MNHNVYDLQGDLARASATVRAMTLVGQAIPSQPVRQGVLTNVSIFDKFYGEQVSGMPSLDDAIDHTLQFLPHEDFPYMIGYSDERGILAFVFQGQVYRIEETL